MKAPSAPNVVLNVMLEQWADDRAPSLGPMGNPMPAGVLDHQARSWARYGTQTGARRLLEMLEELQAPATWYVSGLIAEQHPGLVRRIADAGHEVAGHGWSQDVVNAALDRDAEYHAISRCLGALRHAGATPRGWISPRCTPSAHTAELLASLGFEWFGDVFDDDHPYELSTPSGSICALPFGMEVNDLPLMVRYGAPARELVASFVSTLSAAAAAPECPHVDVTVHAHVGGRPVGREQLRRIVEHGRSEGARLVTRGELVSQAAFQG